jgi:hypothetical protein
MTDSEDTGIHYIPAACKDELPGERTSDRDSLLGADDAEEASENKSYSAGSEEKEESAAAAAEDDDDDNKTSAESEAEWGTQENKDKILDVDAVFANKPAPANDWGDESSDFVVVAEKISAAPDPELALAPVVHQPNTIHVASAFRFSPASKAANAKPSPFVALFTGDAAADTALTPTLAAFESSMSEANMWSSGLFLELLKDNPDRIKSSIVRAIHAAPDRAKAASAVLRASLANLNDLNSINSSVALDSSARTALLSDAEIRSIAGKESSDPMLVEHLSRAMRNGSRVPFIDTERSDHAVAAAVLNDVVRITSSIVKNAAEFIKSSRPFRTRAAAAEAAAFPTYSAAAAPTTKFLSREEQIQRRLAAMTIE